MRLFLKVLLLPPAINLLAMVAALVIWRRYPKIARGLLVASLASLWLLSTPWVSDVLMVGLENDFPVFDSRAAAETGAQAIVILTAGRYNEALEFGGIDEMNAAALERARYGAYLHRLTGLPILTTGGTLFPNDQGSLASVMARALVRDFAVPVRWTEDQSKTTWENGLFSKSLLAAEGIDNIILVTQAYHMKRAVLAFEEVGFTVTPAPTAFVVDSGVSLRWDLWLPTARALNNSSIACHEWLGRLYYALFY